MKRLFWLGAAALVLSGCQLGFTTVGSWAPQAPAPGSITGAAVGALPDGKVVVVGGVQQQTGRLVAQTLLFDPRADRWTQAAPIPEPRTGDALLALRDGRVLVTAGQGASSGTEPPPLATTWLYNPLSDTWTRVGNLHTARTGPTAAALADGRVLLVGGSVLREQPLQLSNGGIEYLKDVGSTEIFDPRTESWSLAGDLSPVRSNVSVVPLADGTALAAGGCSGGALSALSSAELFDPPTQHWSPTTSLPQARCGASGLALADGRALIVGGSRTGTNGFEPVLSAVLFNPRTRSWSSAGTLLASVGTGPGPGAVAVLLTDGRVFAPAEQAGPQQGRVTTTIVGGQVYTPEADDWTFATSTSVSISSPFGQPSGPLVVGLPSDRAVVLHEGVTLAFNAARPPPSGQTLESATLTWTLLALAGTLALFILAIGYIRARTMRSAISTKVSL